MRRGVTGWDWKSLRNLFHAWDSAWEAHRPISGSLTTKLDCHRMPPVNVRFFNRSLGVKRFHTIHQFSVDAACGLVPFFGIGTIALPSWDSKTRWNNFWVLAV
jgi:hypothetical protein